MATISASPVYTYRRPPNVVSNQPEEQYSELDKEWIDALRVRIKEAKASMVAEAERALQNKLNEGFVDEAMRQRLLDEHERSLKDIDELMLAQYQEEINRERAERRWAAGGQVDSEWSEALIKEQQAILDTIKKEKQDEQPQESNDSASDLSKHLTSVGLNEAIPMSTIDSQRRHRPAPPLDRGPRNDRDEYTPSPDTYRRPRPPPPTDYGVRYGRDEHAPLPDPSVFVESPRYSMSDSPRRSDVEGAYYGGRERRGSGRRSSSSSTKMSVGEFWRPPVTQDEQPMASRTYSQQSMSTEALRRRDSVSSLGRSNTYMPPGSEVYSPSDAAAHASYRSQKEREEVAEAEVPWTDINRRNKDRSSQEVRFSAVSSDGRPTLNYPPPSGPSASQQASGTPNGPSGSVSHKPIVNKKSFIREDPANRQVSPNSGSWTTPARIPRENSGTFPSSGSFEDRQSLRSANPPMQSMYGSPADKTGSPFQSNLSASRPLSKQTSFVTENAQNPGMSRTMAYSTFSTSPQDPRVHFPSARSPPEDMSRSWQRPSMRSQPSISELRPAPDDAAHSFQGTKPIPVRSPAPRASPYEPNSSIYGARSRSILDFDDASPSSDPDVEYFPPRDVSSKRSQSSLRGMRNHDNVKPRRKDGDDWLAGLDDDIYAIDIEMIEERMLEEAQAESRRIAEEAVRLAEAADIARRAEEARRQEEEATRKAAEAARKAEEVRRMEEEARRKAEEAMKKEEAARLKEEEIRRREAEVRRREEELKRKEQQMRQEEIRLQEEKMRLTAERKRQDSLGSDSGSPRVPSANSGPWSNLNRNGSIGSNASGDRTSKASSTWSSSTNASGSSAQSNSTSATSTSGTSWTSTSRPNPSSGSASARTSAAPNAGNSSANAWGTPPAAKLPNAGTSPYSTNAFSEAEWARRQEEQARKQQEQFRKEQERLENERQAKMSKIMTKDDVIQLFATHERQWNLITTAEELGWYSFPWPVFKKPSEPEDITTVAISAYVLSPHHQSDKSTKDRIKEHIRRWHPDRFETKYLPKVRADEQDKVKEGAGVVVRGLNELLTRSNINSAFS